MNSESSHVVSSHLGIRLEDYDTRIRTFVPYYEEMLGQVSDTFALMAGPQVTLLDLGIGTGALAERCAQRHADVSIIGIDADPGILKMAADRLHSLRPNLIVGNFLDTPLPACDFIVTSLALHHVSDVHDKLSIYRGCATALRPGGALIIADCFLPRDDEAAKAGLLGWLHFLESHYPADEARNLLAAWGQEDTYFALADELSWLTQAGLEVDVVWRRGVFAVLVARKRASSHR